MSPESTRVARLLPRAIPRLLAVGLLAVQPIEYLVFHRFGEPYPALFMPGFLGTKTNAQGETMPRIATVEVTFADGSEATVDPFLLVAEAPESRRHAIFQINFAPAQERAAPGPEYVPPDFRGASAVERLLRSSLPGYLAAATRGKYEPEASPATRRWMADRVRELLPGREPVRATERDPGRVRGGPDGWIGALT
jgi:hypothetical protein